MRPVPCFAGITRLGVTQAIRSQILSRPWVTRAGVAIKIAWAAGRAAAMPVVTGTLRVRKSKASGLTPEAGSVQFWSLCAPRQIRRHGTSPAQ